MSQIALNEERPEPRGEVSVTGGPPLFCHCNFNLRRLMGAITLARRSAQ
jgi:hypothetical protein